MTLKDAIEKVWPGGKITSQLIDKTGFWIVGAPDKPNLLMRPDGTEATVTIGHLTATDWEVVQPDIEVGDVVQQSDCSIDCIVIGYGQGHYNRIALQSLKDDCCACSIPKEEVVLIRKGPKEDAHEIKGDRIEVIEIDRGLHVVKSIAINGNKTHRMTLEAME